MTSTLKFIAIVLLVLVGALVVALIEGVFFRMRNPSDLLMTATALFTAGYLMLVLLWAKWHGRYPNLPKRRLFGTKVTNREEELNDLREQVIKEVQERREAKDG